MGRPRYSHTSLKSNTCIGLEVHERDLLYVYYTLETTKLNYNCFFKQRYLQSDSYYYDIHDQKVVYFLLDRPWKEEREPGMPTSVYYYIHLLPKYPILRIYSSKITRQSLKRTLIQLVWPIIESNKNRIRWSNHRGLWLVSLLCMCSCMQSCSIRICHPLLALDSRMSSRVYIHTTSCVGFSRFITVPFVSRKI